MYLKKSQRKNGRIYLSICMNYREGGKNKTKTILPIGYADQFDGVYEDPIAHFRALAKSMHEEHSKKDAPIVLQIDPSKKIDLEKRSRKNLGYAVFSSYYHKLGLHTFWQGKSIEEYLPVDANAIFKMLTYTHLLYPSGIRTAYMEKDRWFERSDFTLTDLYRSFTFFCKQRQALLEKVNTSIDKFYKRPTDRLFFHVNRFRSKFFNQKMLADTEDAESEVTVKVGLLVDDNGVPMSYRLFFEDISDRRALEIISEERTEAGKKEQTRIVIIADEAMQAEDVVEYLSDNEGFILAQRFPAMPDDFKEWVREDSDYQTAGDIHFKSRLTSLARPSDTDGSTSTIPVRQIAFRRFDFAYPDEMQSPKGMRKYKGRYKASNKKPLSKPGNVLRSGTPKTDTETSLDNIITDEVSLALDEVLEGYRIIVTSEVDLDEENIIALYREYWKNREDFSFLEGDLLTRPVYLSGEEIVEMHFLVRYVALVLVRLVCFDTEGKYSPIRIREELSCLECSHLDGSWWNFDYRSVVTDELCKLVGIDLSSKTLSLKQIKNVLSHTRTQGFNPNQSSFSAPHGLRQWIK